MTRVHIGEKGGRMGIWVSPIGVDASSPGGRMLLDSDLDMLRPHAGIFVSHNSRDHAEPNYQVPGDFLYDPVAVTFPALPDIPFVLVNYGTNDPNYWPMTWPPLSIVPSGGAYSPDARAYRDRVYIGPVSSPTTVVNYYIFVFQNPMPR